MTTITAALWLLAQTAPPTLPQPDRLPLPGPAWLLETLLFVGFLLHLLAMNVVVGATLLAAISARCGARRPDHARLHSALAYTLPPAFALAVTLGIVPLLFMQVLHGHWLYTSSILIAWPWLLVPLLVMAAYHFAHDRHHRAEHGSRPRLATAWLGLLLLLTVAAVFTVNLTLLQTPERWLPLYLAAPDGLQLPFGDPQLAPRYLHTLLGALAVTGLYLAWRAGRLQSAEPEHAVWLRRYGLRWFVSATAIEAAVGLWYLMALPRSAMLQFMGRQGLATALLAGGLLLTMAVLVYALLAVRRRRPLWPLYGGMAILLPTMVAMRTLVRQAMLEPFAGLQREAAQTGALLLFLVVLGLGAATLAWLWRQAKKAKPAAHGLPLAPDPHR